MRSISENTPDEKPLTKGEGALKKEGIYEFF